MSQIIEIFPNLYQVGGGELSSPDDCCVYLLECEGVSVLIDSGVGRSAPLIIRNMENSGINIESIKYIIATHGHIDHIGGLNFFQKKLKASIIAHYLELPAIEEGLPHLTAASWYGVNYQRVKVDRILKESQETVQLGKHDLVCVHTPGHTRGSIAVYVDINQTRILFGQDIHGPFFPDWGSDLEHWRESMKFLLDLRADILCEGHFGVYFSATQVSNYIESCLQKF